MHVSSRAHLQQLHRHKMHGRIKVKSTEEQKEAKRKEQEKKLQLYNAATKQAFTKRKEEEYDEEALKVSGEILYRNSDFYTMWNIRKEIFMHMKKNKDEEELQKLLENELDFLESCLKYNPKSYGTWHHRCFVMDTIPKPNWGRELQLCNIFLQFDERNFHCWDYRRYVVKSSNVAPEAELEFTSNKISSNFSNYSSWHYRSKLLPVIHPDPSSPVGVKEEILLKEYEMVQNAFFTDPDDQSAWFYHRWLLGRGKKDVSINCVCWDQKHSEVIVSTTEPVLIPTKSQLSVEIDGSPMSSIWRTCTGRHAYSNLWISDIPVNCRTSGCCTVTLTVDGRSTNCQLMLGDDKMENCYFHTQAPRIWFRSELSAATKETLVRELESVQELHEMEPQNKWVLFTAVSLMKSLNPISYEATIIEHLDKLESIDSSRTAYYKDLRSKYLTENSLENVDLSQRSLSITGAGLTMLSHVKFLSLLVELDLSDNKLISLADFCYLHCLQKLNLDDNNICDLQALKWNVHLQELSIRNNAIKTADVFQALTGCPLVTVSVSGNPFCDTADIKSVLPKILTGLQQIDDVKLS